MGGKRRVLGTGLVAATICGIFAAPAHAVPKLQLYIQGASWDATDESWVTTSSSFRLWVVGDANTAPITDVTLVAAYNAINPPGFVDLSIAPGTTGGFGGFTDPSTPVAPTFLAEFTDGSIPEMNLAGEKLPNLPPHGIYGANTNYQKWALGDMTLSDSPVGDFQIATPTPHATKTLQINVYDVTVNQVLPGFGVHIDVYGTQSGSNVFAPFSHDAEFSPGPSFDIPEPATGAALLGGAIGLGWARRRSRRTA
jgi:hypothetical protein